ncbi:Uncharacterised protein [Plesiomonas shigelloides]|nr:Uncharacterised protein [Plesiomonas shigelloides]
MGIEVLGRFTLRINANKTLLSDKVSAALQFFRRARR